MKKLFVILILFTLLTACAPSPDKIAAYIEQTRQVQAQIENAIQTGVALTAAAAVTNTLAFTSTPEATNTPEIPNTPTLTASPDAPTQAPYLSPTPTLKLEITLRTVNKCDTPVTVTGVGPVSFTFTLNKDQIDERQLPRGKYSFKDSKGRSWEQNFPTTGTFSWVLCRNS